MKSLFAAIILAGVVQIAAAEPNQKLIKVMCGTKEEFKMTAEKYGEEPIYVGINKGGGQVTSLWANLTTGTSSWVTQVLMTGEWCMIGVGNEHFIPEDSPLKSAPIGTRTTYK